MGYCNECSGYTHNHRIGSHYAHEKFNRFYGGIPKISGYVGTTSKSPSPGEREFFKWSLQG